MRKLLSSVLLISALAGCMGYMPGQQSYWDAQVREMCAKDGGVKVFEIALLNNEQFNLLLNSFGQLSPPPESRASENVPIVQRAISTYIRQSDPEVRRDETALIRNSDKKILAVHVSYSRVGGDVVALHPSYFSCPDTPTNFFSTVIRRQQ
jgi:hypothetical protein